jgi:hypothetical protein
LLSCTKERLHQLSPAAAIGFKGGQADLYAYAGNDPVNFLDPFGTDKKGLWTCAAENAEKVSIAGLAQSLGAPTDGIGGFALDALGGNVFSGATDLVQSLGSGEAGGHNVFYHLGQGVAAGPTLGFAPGLKPFVGNLDETPWTSGPVDALTDALVDKVGSLVTGSGETIQTLNDTVELGKVLSETGEAAEYASGFGEIKFGYDLVTWLGSLAGCGAGILE